MLASLFFCSDAVWFTELTEMLIGRAVLTLNPAYAKLLQALNSDQDCHGALHQTSLVLSTSLECTAFNSGVIFQM